MMTWCKFYIENIGLVSIMTKKPSKYGRREEGGREGEGERKLSNYIKDVYKLVFIVCLKHL
jgi:hypothetical protein